MSCARVTAFRRLESQLQKRGGREPRRSRQRPDLSVHVSARGVLSPREGTRGRECALQVADRSTGLAWPGSQVRMQWIEAAPLAHCELCGIPEATVREQKLCQLLLHGAARGQLRATLEKFLCNAAFWDAWRTNNPLFFTDAHDTPVNLESWYEVLNLFTAVYERFLAGQPAAAVLFAYTPPPESFAAKKDRARDTADGSTSTPSNANGANGIVSEGESGGLSSRDEVSGGGGGRDGGVAAARSTGDAAGSSGDVVGGTGGSGGGGTNRDGTPVSAATKGAAAGKSGAATPSRSSARNKALKLVDAADGAGVVDEGLVSACLRFTSVLVRLARNDCRAVYSSVGPLTSLITSPSARLADDALDVLHSLFTPFAYWRAVETADLAVDAMPGYGDDRLIAVLQAVVSDLDQEYMDWCFDAVLEGSAQVSDSVVSLAPGHGGAGGGDGDRGYAADGHQRHVHDRRTHHHHHDRDGSVPPVRVGSRAVTPDMSGAVRAKGVLAIVDLADERVAALNGVALTAAEDSSLPATAAGSSADVPRVAQEESDWGVPDSQAYFYPRGAELLFSDCVAQVNHHANASSRRTQDSKPPPAKTRRLSAAQSPAVGTATTETHPSDVASSRTSATHCSGTPAAGGSGAAGAAGAAAANRATAGTEVSPLKAEDQLRLLEFCRVCCALKCPRARAAIVIRRVKALRLLFIILRDVGVFGKLDFFPAARVGALFLCNWVVPCMRDRVERCRSLVD